MSERSAIERKIVAGIRKMPGFDKPKRSPLWLAAQVALIGWCLVGAYLFLVPIGGSQ